MSGKICAMYGCNNYELQKNSRPFFRFPRDKNILKPGSVPSQNLSNIKTPSKRVSPFKRKRQDEGTSKPDNHIHIQHCFGKPEIQNSSYETILPTSSGETQTVSVEPQNLKEIPDTTISNLQNRTSFLEKKNVLEDKIMDTTPMAMECDAIIKADPEEVDEGDGNSSTALNCDPVIQVWLKTDPDDTPGDGRQVEDGHDGNDSSGSYNVMKCANKGSDSDSLYQVWVKSEPEPVESEVISTVPDSFSEQEISGNISPAEVEFTPSNTSPVDERMFMEIVKEETVMEDDVTCSVIPSPKDIQNSPKFSPKYPCCLHRIGKECMLLKTTDIDAFHRSYHECPDKKAQDAFLLQYCRTFVPHRQKRTPLVKTTNIAYSIVDGTGKYVAVCRQTFVSALRISPKKVIEAFRRIGNDAVKFKESYNRKPLKQSETGYLLFS